MDKVLYGNNFNNTLINNTIFHLLNFEKYSSFPQALREAALNNDFQMVLLSEEFNTVFAVETRQKTTIDAAIRRGREVALNLGNVYSLVEIDGVTFGYRPDRTILKNVSVTAKPGQFILHPSLSVS